MRLKLAALMLVGPGEADRHLERALKRAREWADKVIVYGDGPDPHTRQLIGSYAHYARIGDRALYETSEHLARNQLFEVADEILTPGDIVSVLDADEEYAGRPNDIATTLRALEHDRSEAWNVHFLHLWTPDGRQHRVDGMWQPAIGTRIYRHRPGYRVSPINEHTWVCPPVPASLCWALRAPILDVLHWSYARPEDRQPKYERYSKLPGHHPEHVRSIIDPDPVLEHVPWDL